MNHGSHRCPSPLVKVCLRKREPCYGIKLRNMWNAGVPMDPFTYRDTCSAVGAAAREGDCELLYRLIQEGKPIDVRDNRGWSPLHEAAAHNSSKCMKVLLAFMEDPEDINLQTFEGETPLFLTGMSNCDESMKVLLENGANVNIANHMDQTPLMKLLNKKVVNPLCLELLLQYGANVNAKMWNGWTALHEAACKGNSGVLKRLLQEGASMEAADDHEIQPVFTAAQYGNIECLKVLLEAGADPNSRATDEATALYIAAQEDFPDCIRLLLSYGARTDLKVGGYATPLHVAAWKGNIRCMEILDPITKPCLKRYTPLHHAAQNGQLEAVKFLIANGHDKETGIKFDPIADDVLPESQPEHRPEPPLICALEEKKLEVAEYLLSLGLPHTFNCQLMHCPLYISFPHIPSLKLLLKYGADINCGHLNIWGDFLNNWDDYKFATKFVLDHGMKVDLNCKYVTREKCEMESISEELDFSKYVKLVSHYMTTIKLCKHALASLQKVGQLDSVRKIIDNPPTLQSLCRMVVRNQVGSKRMTQEDWVEKLPVPPPVKDVLLCKDVPIEDDDDDDDSSEDE